MFLFSFNNSTCTLSRDLTCLCVVIRIFTLHHVWCHIGTSCTNCGVRRPSDGLCSRCLDLPYCKVCKRHLENNCFNEVQRKICQVHLQIILFLHVTITCILHTDFTNWIIIWHIAIVTRSLVCVCFYRTVKNDVPYDAPLSITSCLKLRYPWPNTTHPLKRLSTHVNTLSRTLFETPYNSTGTNAFVLL